MAGDAGMEGSNQQRKVLSVAVTATAGFTAGPPQPAFEWFGSIGQIAPDGQRVLVLRRDEPAVHPTEIRAVLNWFEELKEKVPER